MFPLPRRAFLAALATALPACQRQKPVSNPLISRVISLSPSTTEAVFAIGAGDRLVGRSRFCNYPPAAKALPSVGGFVDASFEAILGLAPQLVVGVRGPSGPALAERLAARGIATYFPPTDDFAQIDAMLTGLGQRLDAVDGARRAKQVIADAVARVARALAGRPKPRALMVFGLRPIVAAGRGGFPDEMLRRAGATNVVSGERYPTLGVERVLALDPDVVIDATGAEGHSDGDGLTKGLPGWSELRALKDGKLITVRDERVLRPGPRVGEGLVVLARALHPKAGL